MQSILSLFSPQKLFEQIVFQSVVVLSGWLSRNASHRWKKVVRMHERGVSQGIGGTESAAPKAVKTTSLESLTQQGFAVDTARQIEDAVHLPRWAREIQPFLQNQLSRHTRRAYETDLKQFFFFLERYLTPGTFHSLRAEHVILFRKHLEEGRLTGKPLEKVTVNRKLAVVKSYLNWLRANQVIVENPATLVKGFPQSQESTLTGLSDIEAKRMLELPRTNSRSGSLHAAILATLLYLGLRKGELIALTLGSLDEDRGVSIIKVPGKGHRLRVLPITPLVKSALENYFHVCGRDLSDKDAPLFIPTKNPRTGTLRKPLNPHAITYIVGRYAEKSGVVKRVSPHSCRATCISNALDRRATHRSVQHLAGWTTPLMIQRYDKRRDELKNSAAYLVDYTAAS